jgi:ribonuclease P protein component
MLTKTLRMKRNTQFSYVFKKGQMFKAKGLMMIVAPKRYKTQKIGLVVTKKIGKSVVRNHVKRLIRESIRVHLSLISPTLDLIIVARQGVESATFQEINKTILELLKKSNALNES